MGQPTTPQACTPPELQPRCQLRPKAPFTPPPEELNTPPSESEEGPPLRPPFGPSLRPPRQGPPRVPPPNIGRSPSPSPRAVSPERRSGAAPQRPHARPKPQSKAQGHPGATGVWADPVEAPVRAPPPPTVPPPRSSSAQPTFRWARLRNGPARRVSSESPRHADASGAEAHGAEARGAQASSVPRSSDSAAPRGPRPSLAPGRAAQASRPPLDEAEQERIEDSIRETTSVRRLRASSVPQPRPRPTSQRLSRSRSRSLPPWRRTGPSADSSEESSTQ